MVYTPGVLQCLNKIFSAVLVGGLQKNNPIFDSKIKLARICYARFTGIFPSNVFQDEYAIFYDILVNLNAKVFTLEQLNEIVYNNRDLILDSPYYDISKYSYVADDRQATDDEKIEAVKANLEEMLIELSNTLVTEEEFQSSCVIFIDWYKNQYMLETSQAMTRIMTDLGYEERRPGKRRVTYKGWEDAQRYYNERQKIMRELSAENRIQSEVLDINWLERQNVSDNTPDTEALFSIGIPEVDAILGEIRRGNMIGILGPPKGGKTKFANFMVARALSMGFNVAVWPLEGTQAEWESMQFAAYIKEAQGVTVSSSDILAKKYRNDPKLKSWVSAARVAIATDPKRGRLSFIKGIAYEEDFIDVLDQHYENENPFDVIVIDSLVNVMSKGSKGKVERISEAYMKLKSYITGGMKRGAAAICPAQLKQTVIDYLRAHPNEEMDITAGAESAETIRTPDAVIGLFSTKAERAANMMKISNVASRHTATFDDMYIRCELECVNFYSDPTLN